MTEEDYEKILDIFQQRFKVVKEIHEVLKEEVNALQVRESDKVSRDR